MTARPTSSTDPAVPLPAPAPGSRRAEIALVAGEEFTRRGYHWTRVEHIAERLSITPGALYRHVPGKYEMFRDAVAILVADLDAASEPPPDRPASLDQLVESLTRCTMRHRTRVGLYRWQARYLLPEHRAAVDEVDARVRRRLADAVRERRRRRGHLPSPGAGSAAAAIASCIASLGQHRIDVPEAEAVALMCALADDLAGTPADQLPGPGSPSRGEGAAGARQRDETAVPRLRRGAATREGAIEAAIARFHLSGYESVTMEAIGADVGVAASALYRHFPGKSALLAAAVTRTAALVEELLDGHAVPCGPDGDAADTLSALLSEYVGIAFSHGPDLLLYHSELGALDAEDRLRLRRAQRRQLDRWAALLLEAVQPATGGPRSGRRAVAPAPAGVRIDDAVPPAPAEVRIDDAVARIRVHAALAVVLDGGQGTGFHPAAAPRFHHLASRVLLPR